MKKGKRIAFILSGMVLMIAAAGLTAYNLNEDANATESASYILEKFSDEREKLVESTEEPSLPTGITGEIIEETTISPDTPMPTISIDGVNYIGTLTIPALGIELPVAENWDYTQMKISPCRYEGSVYKNDLIICAHNYSTHFRNIKDLQNGDDVIFVDAVGNNFNYQVELVETLQPTAINEMISSEYDLSLFTCNYAGNARVTVRCNQVEE